MGTLSTFGIFTMTRLGVYAATQGLNVSGNNVTNINTEGYTRQVLDQTSLHMSAADRYSTQSIHMGSGVLAPGVYQIRDQFLDIRYRKANSGVGYMESELDGLDHLSSLLDEVNKGNDQEGVLEAMFNDMVDQMDQLAAQGAGKDQDDTLFRASVETLTRQLNKTASDLEELRGTRIEKLQEDIGEVNKILEQIRDLTTTIRKNTIYGDNSLEQLDQRNLLLDKLSEYMDIDVVYTEENLTPTITWDKLTIRTGTDPQRIVADGLYASTLELRVGTDEGEDPNFDLNFLELRDIHGHGKILREGDLGAVKNRDAGAMTLDENGEYVVIGEGDEMEPLEFLTEEEAQALCDQLNETANGVEYRLQYDDGVLTVHQYTTTFYASSEDAYAALEELNAAGRDYTEHTNPVTGEVTRYTNRIVNMGSTFEIHQFEVFYGKVQLGDTELGGGLLADREILTEEGIFSTQEDLDGDPNAASKRGIVFYQKALDVLANTLASTLNDANTIPDQELYETRQVDVRQDDGSYLTTYEFIDADGNPVTDGDRSKYVLKKEYSYYNGGVLLSNKSTDNDDTGITAANISISKNWANGSFRVLRTKQPQDLDSNGNPIPASTLNDNLNHIRNLLIDKHAFMPNNAGIYSNAASDEPFFTGSFQELFTDHIAVSLATDKSYVSTMLNNNTIMADQLYVNRDGVQGVDLNDEAVNMMQYQKAYDAACRLMTVYDEMLDKLINGTAV